MLGLRSDLVGLIVYGMHTARACEFTSMTASYSDSVALRPRTVLFYGSQTDSSFPSLQSGVGGRRASSLCLCVEPAAYSRADVTARVCIGSGVPQSTWGNTYRYSSGVWKPPNRGGLGYAGVRTREYHCTSNRWVPNQWSVTFRERTHAHSQHQLLYNTHTHMHAHMHAHKHARTRTHARTHV